MAANVDGLAKCGLQHLSSRLRELSYENKLLFFENVSCEAVNPKPLMTIGARNLICCVSTRILPNRCWLFGRVNFREYSIFFASYRNVDPFSLYLLDINSITSFLSVSSKSSMSSYFVYQAVFPLVSILI